MRPLKLAALAAIGLAVTAGPTIATEPGTPAVIPLPTDSTPAKTLTLAPDNGDREDVWVPSETGPVKATRGTYTLTGNDNPDTTTVNEAYSDVVPLAIRGTFKRSSREYAWGTSRVEFSNFDYTPSGGVDFEGGEDTTHAPRFTLEPGEQVRVMGTVVADYQETIRNSQDDIFMVVTTLSCRVEGASTYVHTTLTQNVERGSTLTLKPRLVYTANPADSARKKHYCKLAGATGRPRPVENDFPGPSRVGMPDDLAANRLRLTGSMRFERVSGASFASAKIEPASDNESLRVVQSPETVPSPAQSQEVSAKDLHPRTFDVPAGATGFRFTYDLLLTSCTAVGGSTDPVTDRELCLKEDDDAGSGTINKAVAKVQPMIMRYSKTDPGAYCNWPGTSSPYHRTGQTGNYTITRNVHHRAIAVTEDVPVTADTDCGNRYRVKLNVSWAAGGTPFVVHRDPGSLSVSVIPYTTPLALVEPRSAHDPAP